MEFPRICIVGAGFSGLCIAALLKTELGILNLKIYDTAEEVGGTWHANQYPGVACDVPGFLYSFSFFRKYDWSALFSPGVEFQQYASAMVNHFEMEKNLFLAHTIQHCHWQPERGQWLVTVENHSTSKNFQETFDFLINATGKSRLPNVPTEFLQFKGTLLHSAAWSPSIQIENRRVGVVGTGASAIQIVSVLPEKVRQLVVFQRTPHHIIPRPQFVISDKFKWAIEKVPALYLATRYTVFCVLETLYTGMKKGTIMNVLLTKLDHWWRHRQLGHKPELLSKTTPHYTLGCKRLIVSSNFYPALTAPNVKLVTEKIKLVEDHCIVTEDGNKHNLDVLVLATGFQSSEYFSPLKVIGKDGIDIHELWKRRRPNLYLGIMGEEAPNFFTILGPYGQTAHNSHSLNIEIQAAWIVKAINLALQKQAQIISIRKEAVDRCMKHLDEGFQGKVWENGGCTSWYIDGQQRNVMLWTHSQIDFWRYARNVTEDLFHFSNI